MRKEDHGGGDGGDGFTRQTMAEQNPARLLSAAFPTPPPFYKHFTKQNVTRLRELRKEAEKNQPSETDGSGNAVIDVASLPPELRFLVPPEPPADGRYKAFGADYDVCLVLHVAARTSLRALTLTSDQLAQPTQSLESAGIPQLYPADVAESEPTLHLQKLTQAILLNFLELVGTLSVNPTQATQKVEDLQNLFYNVHDLINRYRPHQARESLILMMEEQVDKVKQDIARVNEAKEKMVGLLKGIEGLQTTAADTTSSEPPAKPPSSTESNTKSPEQRRLDAQRSMWDTLDSELGG